MKETILIILCIMLCAFIFAGCSRDDTLVAMPSAGIEVCEPLQKEEATEIPKEQAELQNTEPDEEKPEIHI